MSATACGIYLRISQDRDGEGLGVARQEEACRALADKLGWVVAEIYEDNDVSAYGSKVRPAYQRLLKDIEDGKIAGLLAWHPDRLFRRPIELEHFIDIVAKAGLQIHTVESGTYDLSSDSGQAIARTLGAWARYESAHKGKRIAAARKQAAIAGKHHGGVRPFGYEKDGMTLRNAEAAEIFRAAEEILAGASLRSLVQDLNSRKVSTALGAPRWTSQTLRDILLSPRTAGLSTWRGEVVGKALWPAMIDEDKWRAVGAILNNPARRTRPAVGGAVKWLGSGLYICGVCGERTLRVGGGGSVGRRTYRCANRNHEKTTGHVTREAKSLDSFVEHSVVTRLSVPGVIEGLLAPVDTTVDVDALRVEKVELEERLDEQAVLHAQRVITARQMAIGSEVMVRRLTEIDALLARQVGSGPFAELAGVEDLRLGWFGSEEGEVEVVPPLSLAIRRMIVDAVVDVTVKKVPDDQRTRDFDPRHIAMDWKV
ncbi:recombinase family protein [Rhodococcus qingshengii]|uniref:recombinase family protein n=1 Tax=Rhodococcus qingshengii TaxID=334542 RepID=UPI001E5F04F2|nr:recombinase family protein [Rhodococcus qingshengii]MCD2134541.1 recombinase family protein [Rhodococcus qingshengii]